jgi:succinate dehydrogenase/fumarate reductase cytochrome b subunit
MQVILELIYTEVNHDKTTTHSSSLLGITGIASLSLAGADVNAVMSSIGSIAAVGTLAKFSVAFPFIYHYAAGVRHLMWDRSPEMLENADVEKSSYIVLGSSTTASLLLALL